MPQSVPDRANFVIDQWWPTVVYRCLCTPDDPQVLTIVGTQTESVCPRCSAARRLEHFAYDRKTDSIAIALGERAQIAPILPPH